MQLHHGKTVWGEEKKYTERENLQNVLLVGKNTEKERRRITMFLNLTSGAIRGDHRHSAPKEAGGGDAYFRKRRGSKGAEHSSGQKTLNFRIKAISSKKNDPW